MKQILSLLTSLCLCCLSVLPVYARSQTVVTIFDVGQASSALIESDGYYALIDGGNRSDSSMLYSVLNRKGITRLDLVIASHSHEDHIGGLAGAMKKAPATTVLSPVTDGDSKVFENLKKAAGKLIVPKAGQTYKVGDAKVQIISLNADKDNDSSIIAKVTDDEVSFLFSGDAEAAGENKALNSGYSLDSDVYIVGHHGSDTSTSPEFLKAISPDISIISCGKNNSYGFPHQLVIDDLKKSGTKLYRTDLQGDITCKTDGKTVACTPDKNAAAKVFAAGKTSSKEETKNTETTSSHYVLNTRSKKFHRPDCPSVKKMSARNRQDSEQRRDELIKSGYSPCKNCNP